jgi:hypothetical protein
MNFGIDLHRHMSRQSKLARMFQQTFLLVFRLMVRDRATGHAPSSRFAAPLVGFALLSSSALA